MRSYERSLAILRRLGVEHPDDHRVRDEMGETLTQHRPPASRDRPVRAGDGVVRQALEIAERLLAAHPKVRGYRVSVARTHRNLGLVLSAMGRPAEAIASHNKGLADLRELVRAMPAVTQYRSELAKGLNHLGKLLQAQARRTRR